MITGLIGNPLHIVQAKISARFFSIILSISILFKVALNISLAVFSETEASSSNVKTFDTDSLVGLALFDFSPIRGLFDKFWTTAITFYF